MNPRVLHGSWCVADRNIRHTEPEAATIEELLSTVYCTSHAKGTCIPRIHPPSIHHPSLLQFEKRRHSSEFPYMLFIPPFHLFAVLYSICTEGKLRIRTIVSPDCSLRCTMDDYSTVVCSAIKQTTDWGLGFNRISSSAAVSQSVVE